MLKNCILIIGLVLTFAVNNPPLFAQEKRLNSSPRAFRTFYAKFKKAVIKRDKTAIASMTRFPFKYAFDAGDEGTISKTQFIKNFNEIFGDSPSRFFDEKNPLFHIDEDGDYVISTDDAAHQVFVKQGRVFKFAAYLAEP